MLETFFALILLYIGAFFFIALIVLAGFGVFYIFLYAYDSSTADKTFKQLLKWLIEDIFGKR